MAETLELPAIDPAGRPSVADQVFGERRRRLGPGQGRRGGPTHLARIREQIEVIRAENRSRFAGDA